MKQAGWAITAALVLAASAAFAGLDVYDSVTVKTLQRPLAKTGTTTNTAVDVSAAKGICNWLVILGPRTSGAATFTGRVDLTSCATSGGTYSTVASKGVAAVSGTGYVYSVKIDAQSLSRYVKCVFTLGTNAAVVGSELLYSK
jgi:hypothetical protein